MSETITDLAKVTQMLDAGWLVRLYRGPMGSYEARASHPNAEMRGRVKVEILKRQPQHVVYEGMTALESVEFSHFDDDGELMTDDFTPEQALTRLAYKVHGEIL